MAHLRWYPLAAAVFGLCLVNSPATVHYVDANSSNPVSPYTTWATAATNIQDAVWGAGTVLVTNGVYQFGGFDYFGSNRVFLPAGVTVQSVNGPAVTIINGYQVSGATNGNNAVRCAYLSSGASISGFTLSAGATRTDVNSHQGGGVCCESNSAIVTNCVIAGNAAYYEGGGVYSGTVVNCILSNNVAGSGGNGGGAGYSVLVNCLLARNTAGYVGGAAHASTLINCTVVSNSTASYAGALASATAKNCIIYHNPSVSFPDDSGNGAAFTNCCTSTPATLGINNFTNPPLFADLANGDFHLNPASPCLNVGNNSFVTFGTDLNGGPRIFGSAVDLGAYEFQRPVHYVSLGNPIPQTPYTNWTTAATNIQDAIDVATVGDCIVVSNGIYQSGGRVVFGTMTNRVVIDKSVTVQSVNGPGSTTIAGLPGTGGYFSSGFRCAYLADGATLSGFTLTNGATHGSDLVKEQSGGAVWCESSNAVIANCVLAHSYANQYGGGAYQGTLNNCILSNNTAFISGGGAYLANLNNCVVSSNRLVQGSGGGGVSFGVLSNCVVAQNSVPGSGGGAYFSTLINCVVSNNGAQFGGGVYAGFASGCLVSSNRASQTGGGACSNSISHCILQNNYAAQSGGGAFNAVLDNCLLRSNSAAFGGGVCAGLLGPATILNNCTICGNTASTEGGGLDSDGQAAPSRLFATNCIIWGNTAPNGSNYFYAFPGELALNYCCTAPFLNGSGNITNAPSFLNEAGSDFHLRSSSPCINSGNNAFVGSTTDLDGNPRVSGGTADIGAYEFQNPASLISYAWLQQYGLPVDGSADFLDADHDGLNNWQEWRCGTDPRDATSLLVMLSVSNSVPGIAVTWQSVSGKMYYLQRSADLTLQNGFAPIQNNIQSQAGTTRFTDTNALGAGPYYYRVGIQN